MGQAQLTMAGSPDINLAVRILRQVATGTPADFALREALKRTRHRSAPAERRAVSGAVFAYFRWLHWLEARDSLAKQLDYALVLQERFKRDPAVFKPEALAARAIPGWLTNEIPWPEGEAAVVPQGPGALEGKRPDREIPAGELGSGGAVAPNGPFPVRAAPAKSAPTRRPYPTELGWLRHLQREPVLWIRTKSGLEQKISSALGFCAPATAASGGEAGSPPPFPATTSALHYTGPKDLFHTEGFQAGDFEIQDLASQLVGHACAPQPGETWWDACAGEGGKTLHLADLMQNKGMIWASDRSARRLAKLKERAARARVFNYRAASWEGDARLPTRTKFDGVLVDAPCTGIGTWQRNPHARWTTQPKDVEELAAVQARLLGAVAGSLKPGGRLVYSVCTLTRAETTDVAGKFTAAHPDFEPAPLSALHAQLPAVFLWPPQLNANGMFLASWRRK
jgi:16S rRNA (cytosine967-C5)-methyltransferase